MARIREFAVWFPYMDLLRTHDGTQAWSRPTTQQGGVSISYGISCNVRQNITREYNNNNNNNCLKSNIQ